MIKTREAYLEAAHRYAVLNQCSLRRGLTTPEVIEREKVRRIHDAYQGSLNHRWHLFLGHAERWYYRLPRWLRRG